MKYIFSALFISILFVGCVEKAISSEKNNQDANFIEYNSIFTKAFTNVKFEKFWNENHDGKSYKYGSGEDLEGNSFEARITDGQKESCIGIGCSECNVRPTGGCSCDKRESSKDYCNHTITRSDDI